MKRKYEVMLYLGIRDTIEIETEEEDEEKIKENVRQGFIQDVLDVDGARDLLEKTEGVNIKLKEPEGLKDHIVTLNVTSATLSLAVKAYSPEDAADKLDSELTTLFRSDDGNTDCEVWDYDLEGAELAEWEKEAE